MKKLISGLKYVPLAALALLVGASVVAPSGRTDAVPTCPSVVKVRGSTTLHPATAQAEPIFEGQWPGTDAQPAYIGSGNGLNELRLFNGTNHVAPSSRPLSASEAAQLYGFLVGRDGFVIAVKNSGNMGFINNITKSQVEQIYEGTITNWNQLGGPNQPIVPRARITESGSYVDFLSQFAIDSTLEANTIANTGLGRLTESSDMAQAAAANDFQIAYTSLANLFTAGMKALSLNGVAPNHDTVANGTYPSIRTLWYAVPKTSFADRIDDTSTVRGDDWVNFMLSSAGQLLMDQEFVSVGAPALPPIPDWDINMDGSTTLGDLIAITAKWGQATSCGGWIRADANNSANVSLGDIGVVTGRWGGAGFVPPN